MPALALRGGKSGESPAQVRYCIVRYLYPFPGEFHAAATGRGRMKEKPLSAMMWMAIFFVMGSCPEVR